MLTHKAIRFRSFSSFNIKKFLCVRNDDTTFFLFNGIFWRTPSFWDFGIFLLNGSIFHIKVLFNYVFNIFISKLWSNLSQHIFFGSGDRQRNDFFLLRWDQFLGYENEWKSLLTASGTWRNNALFTLLFLRLRFDAALNSIDFTFNSWTSLCNRAVVENCLWVTQFKALKKNQKFSLRNENWIGSCDFI